ncbi:dethiobiotin synthase [Brevibacillus sp. SAFN-007a]|uniref:dethiobiotin synthase n=1 Tax=Brevibacillus sp. SAFN-007a TaxID=3436862 RepID=UPI003F810A24
MSKEFAGLFVAGTDTEVGKTVVTAGIAAALRERGSDVGVWKPVQSGALAHEETSDAFRLRAGSGVGDLCEEIAPLAFSAPLTPWLAAKAEGRTLTLDEVVAGGPSLMAKHDWLLVEGAGGLAVPLTETEMMVDVAVRLQLPLLLVARAGLGTINHTLLSVWYARSRGLEVAGVILNAATMATDRSVATNAAMIERYGNVSVWGTLPYTDAELTKERLAAWAREHVDLTAIERVLKKQSIKGEIRG